MNNKKIKNAILIDTLKEKTKKITKKKKDISQICL